MSQNQNLFYECKNEIGIRRTYHRAPEGFRSAAEISGHILDFLYNFALGDSELSPDRVVVTVPASFQTNQRQDTATAAEMADLQLTDGELLDEPVAAFLDYLLTFGSEMQGKFDDPKTLLVFDFGGGTCDVAVFELHMPEPGNQLRVAPLAVSRYHRLGGGDIDAAIVHEVLIPQLREQNGLGEFALNYEDKKKLIEPAFLGMAEALKIGLCAEIRRLKSFNQYDPGHTDGIFKTLPGVHTLTLRDRKLSLRSPELTAKQFEGLLEPFLDQDLLYARETEYRLTCSIFAPLQDALEGSGQDHAKVDFCLLVGGSSLIPQLAEPMGKFFPSAEILTYPDAEEIQMAVARGAAYHAATLALFGKALVQPVCHDDIAIRSESGLVKLVPKGTSLPYPADMKCATCYDLAVPETTLTDDVELRVEIVTGEKDERTLFSGIWDIPGPVNRGDPLCLEYSFDENQILHLSMRLSNTEEAKPFKAKIENPLTNVVNPQSTRLKIEELEENLRAGKVPHEQVPDKIVELADSYAYLEQKEKAIDFLVRALRAKNRPDAVILNQLAIYTGELGDYERQEKFYREAASASSWSGPWFNLALAQKRRGLHTEAMISIDKALERERIGPYLVLRAQLADAVEDPDEKDLYLEEAMNSFGSARSLDDWELGWFLTGASMMNDETKVQEAREELRRRRRGDEVDQDDSGQLPIISPAVQTRE